VAATVDRPAYGHRAAAHDRQRVDVPAGYDLSVAATVDRPACGHRATAHDRQRVDAPAGYDLMATATVDPDARTGVNADGPLVRTRLVGSVGAAGQSGSSEQGERNEKALGHATTVPDQG
jgi:hypothetical protein